AALALSGGPSGLREGRRPRQRQGEGGSGGRSSRLPCRRAASAGPVRRGEADPRSSTRSGSGSGGERTRRPNALHRGRKLLRKGGMGGGPCLSPRGSEGRRSGGRNGG